jgi:hypothetical protein
MKTKILAVAGSIAALSFAAAAPVAAVAATTHHAAPAAGSRLDRSRDARGVRHTDKSPDNSRDRAENSRDIRDR